MDETKVIYHIDDEETPYLVKIAISPEKVTLADFKNVLNRPNYKFFFKSMDDDFGVVKEEIIEDSAHLPCFNGRVVSWLVSAEGSNQSDGGGSQCTDGGLLPDAHHQRLPPPPPVQHPQPHVSPSNQHHPHVSSTSHGGHGHHHHQLPPPHSHPPPLPPDSLCTDTESIISSRHGRRHHVSGSGGRYGGTRAMNGHHMPRLYETASIVSSDLETTSFQSETTGRHTALSECSSVSRLHVAGRKRPQRRRKQRIQAMSRTSSYSSITDSTMSLNIITVTLNMDTVNFLGISIVGQSNKGGDGGIYVGSIMKGGAVALDGRIEPGDMILQVNDVNFENMSNDEAVRVLREVVQKPGPIKLVVAKCWDPNPKGYFTIPRTEPVRPIDPGAWVAHTAAVRGDPVARPPSSSTVSSASLASTIPANDRDCLLAPDLDPVETLSVHTPMEAVVQAMQRPDSGLEIRDRMWLKITIPNAFIGTDLVDWLLARLDGFQDRRDARKYASHLLKNHFIRHTVNKITFSEQCYYIFGDLCSAMSNLKLVPTNQHHQQHHQQHQHHGDTDSVGPLPNVPNYMPYSGTYNPLEYIPMPFYTASENTVYGYNREESVLSGSGGSSNGSEHLVTKDTTLMGDTRSGGVGGPGHSSGGASDSDITSLGGGVGVRGPCPGSGGSNTALLMTTGPGGPSSANMMGHGAPASSATPLISQGVHGSSGNGNGSSSTTSDQSSGGGGGTQQQQQLAPSTVLTGASGGNQMGGAAAAAVSSNSPPSHGGASGGVVGSIGNSAASKDLAGSRQSFKLAMGNPCEMFVDVM